MKLALVSMIRDEADILPAFLPHISELFHIGFLLDQRSSDGSQQMMQEFCADLPEWSYFKLDFAGRHQREMSNIFMRRAFEVGADAVVFLDADEFVEGTKDEFYSKIHRLTEEHKIGLLHWIPCVPETFGDDKFNLDQAVYVAGSLAKPVYKVVVTREMFLRTNGVIRLGHGNHAVEGGVFSTLSIGGIYHVPIRSERQMFRKAVLGAVSHLARGNLMGAEGFQKNDMIVMIGEDQLTADKLRGMAAHYAETPGHVSPLRPADLLTAGFQLRKLNVARAQRDIRCPKPVNDYVVVANSLRDVQIEIPDEATFKFYENVVRLNTRSVPFADVPAMRTALQRLQAEIEELRSQMDSLTTQLSSLLGSHSWRITAPLRAISPFLSRLRRASSRGLAKATNRNSRSL